MLNRQIHVLQDPKTLADTAAQHFVASATLAIAAKGSFSVALAGGSTPKAMYELLATKYREQVDWPQVDVFFGDERCVSPEHKDSNYKMAHDALLSKVPVPEEDVFRIRGEVDPQEAAKEYGLMLKEKFGAGGLDLVLLGMGDDGHTASLFPHTLALQEKEHRVVANWCEKSTTGATWRITMTPLFLNRAHEILFLIAGANKADPLRQVLEGPADPERLPMQLIQPISGNLLLLLDAAAAGMA